MIARDVFIGSILEEDGGSALSSAPVEYFTTLEPHLRALLGMESEPQSVLCALRVIGRLCNFAGHCIIASSNKQRRKRSRRRRESMAESSGNGDEEMCMKRFEGLRPVLQGLEHTATVYQQHCKSVLAAIDALTAAAGHQQSETAASS